MSLNNKVKSHLISVSNIIDLVGVYETIDLQDLWFFCGKCTRLLPPEKLYLCQVKDKEELRIQSVSVFVTQRPNGAIRGIESGFNSKRDIVCACGTCIESEGFSVSDISTIPVITSRSIH